VEEAQLVDRLWPDLTEYGWVEWRGVGDNLVGTDAGSTEPLEKALDIGLLDVAVNELVSDKAIAVWSCRIDGEDECQTVLVDLIDTEYARELRDDPGQVVLLEGQAVGVLATPESDHPFAGLDPEVSG